ncbi:YicC/YloC family endoribonuclease [Thermodesulfobacteriota bacterium]
MINSMTAYAKAETATTDMTVRTEIRSYNNRHLDIALRLPNGYQALENRIKNLISERVKRGRVDIKVAIRDDSQEPMTFDIHATKAMAFHHALDRLTDDYDITPQLPFGFLMDAGVIIPNKTEKNMTECWPAISDCIVCALDDLLEMRKTEGRFIAQDLFKRIDFIRTNIELIDQASNDLLSFYQQRLKERITTLTKGLVELDPARIAQEAAFLADKSDISEEIVRTNSHIVQFRSIMETEAPIGQKLNFLVQELHRECNTLGSKTDKVAISHQVVEIKSELEKIREQVQNIE